MKRLALSLAFAVLLAAPMMGCKKKATVETCVAKCSTIGAEHYDRCLLDSPKELCDAAQANGAASCRRTCELSFGKSATSATSTTTVTSAAVTSAAPSSNTFAGTETGARDLLAQFVALDANHAMLSKTLRPTPEDYRALFDAETAAQIEAKAATAWDEGHMVIAPKPGQTEVKLSSATTDDLRDGTPAAKEFPGGYAKVAPHLKPGVVLYRFQFLEPGHDLGMAYDGLAHVNAHWVIVPKPWRMLGPSHEADADPAPSATGATTRASATGTEDSAKGKASPPPKGATMRSGSVSVNGRLPPEIIQRVVRANNGRFRSCYEHGLASNPALKGRVAVKFVIGRSGDVTSASDGGSDLGSPSVVSCVVQTFSRMRFPEPAGGIVTVVYPLVFDAAH